VAFNSGDIHAEMGFVRRYPAVRGAIDAKKFQMVNHLKLVKRTGPEQGATAQWTFSV